MDLFAPVLNRLQKGDEYDVMFSIAWRHVPTSCCLLSRLTSLHFRTSSTNHSNSDQISIMVRARKEMKPIEGRVNQGVELTENVVRKEVIES
jgi:hypothetical protein